MSENNENAGDGRISTERTVWCSGCSEWNQQPSGGHVGTWKGMGWRKRKGLWVCPSCVRRADRKEP